MKILLLSQNRETLYEGKVNGLRLPEPVVIQKSIEFFQDDEPCMIHRSAVAARLYSEIEKALAGRNSAELSGLPRDIKAYFAEYGGAFSVVIKN